MWLTCIGQAKDTIHALRNGVVKGSYAFMYMYVILKVPFKIDNIDVDFRIYRAYHQFVNDLKYDE